MFFLCHTHNLLEKLLEIIIKKEAFLHITTYFDVFHTNLFDFYFLSIFMYRFCNFLKMNCIELYLSIKSILPSRYPVTFCFHYIEKQPRYNFVPEMGLPILLPEIWLP